MHTLHFGLNRFNVLNGLNVMDDSMDDMPNIEQNIKTKIIETGLAITSARRRCGNSSQRLRLRKQSLESWVKRNPLENICI